MDWKATLEEILAERRQRLGERPSADDFIALRAGELADDERERLLEYAAVDPEVGQELFDVLRFPELSDDDPALSEDGLDEAGVDERWRALRDRLPMPLPVSVPMPVSRRYRWLPLAAMFLLGVGAALLFDQGRDPRVNLEIVELLPLSEEPGTARGGDAEGVSVGANTGGLVLTLAVPEVVSTPGLSSSEGPYTLELTRGDGTTTTLSGLSPGLGGVFVLDLPREDLTDGLHELRLKDADGKRVARFRLEVELRR